MAKIYTRIRDKTVVPESEAMNGGFLRDGYRSSAMLMPGERATFSMAFCDSAPAKPVALRDAAGQPVTLHDNVSGGTMKLNADLITAIENEAAKLGMSVHDYVQHVLKYSFSAAKLSGSGNADQPARKETN